jgi:hypothetical protein
MTQGLFRAAFCTACAGLLLALPGHNARAQAEAPAPTPQIYTCIDASGRKLNADRPIRECLDREQTILNPSGTVKARLRPVQTAAERSQFEARIRAEEMERLKREEERRLNRSLLMRYPNPAAHQKERDAAMAQLMQVKQAAQAHVTELQAAQARQADEMAFYAKDPGKAPAKLQREVKALAQTLVAQTDFLSEKDIEIKRVHANFDDEYKRLEPLWRANQASGSLATTQ